MASPLLGQLEWLQGHWLAVVPLVLGFLAIWRLMPQVKPYPRVLGAVLGAAALVAAGLTLFHPGEQRVQDLLFHLFTGVAIVSGVCMITSRNPVYAALWFAVVTLCTCGLHLLRSAPFLAAAMVIVYAGAIIVTFLFLIMLAQQRIGAAVYDQRARQPFFAALLAFLVLGGLLCSLRSWQPSALGDQPGLNRSRNHQISGAAAGDANSARGPNSGEFGSAPLIRPLTQRGEQPVGTVRGLGRTLFGDYLYAVELAGTLLLVASVGAIAIALHSPRKAS